MHRGKTLQQSPRKHSRSSEGLQPAQPPLHSLCTKSAELQMADFPLGGFGGEEFPRAELPSVCWGGKSLLPSTCPLDMTPSLPPVSLRPRVSSAWSGTSTHRGSRHLANKQPAGKRLLRGIRPGRQFGRAGQGPSGVIRAPWGPVMDGHSPLHGGPFLMVSLLSSPSLQALPVHSLICRLHRHPLQKDFSPQFFSKALVPGFNQLHPNDRGHPL